MRWFILIRLLKFVHILSLIFCINIVEYAAAFEQMKSYTVADGLVGPIVPIIYQDIRGVLWFGSDRGGVSSYDGNNFVPYAEFVVSDNEKTEEIRGRTKTIVEDKWGYIWCLSKHPAEGSGVISRYNGTNFEKITVGNCLAVDNDGDIWVGSDNAFTRYKSLNMQDPPLEFTQTISGTSIAIINVIFQSKDDTFWIGGHDAKGALIMKFRTELNMWQIGNLERVENIPNAPKDRAVQVIMQDRNDVLWFGGQSLLFSYDGDQFKDILSTSTETQSGKSQTTTHNGANVSVKSDVYGRIWYSDNRQLSWWDGNTLKRFRKYKPDSSQQINMQGSFEIEDAWNNLWFASGMGAHAYDSKYFEKEENSLFQLEAAQTESTELQPKVYGVDHGLGSDNIITIFEALDGKIWFGHDNGVTSYEQQPVIVNHTTRTILGSNSVRLMKSDSTGTLWLSIPGGVAQYLESEDLLTQHNLTNFVYRSESFSIEINFDNNPNLNRRTEISHIFEADGYIWFIDKPILSQEPLTLYRVFRYKDGKFEKHSLFIQADIGLGGETIYIDNEPIVTSGKNPWIVIGGWVFLPRGNGMHRLLPDGKIRRTSFNSTEALPSPSAAVTALHTDKQDRLWCYYDNGNVKRFSNITIRENYVGGNIQTEVLPLSSVLPVISNSEGNVVQWFYNTVSGQLMYWQNPDNRNTLTELPGAASGAPLLAIQTTLSSQDASESVTLVFHDSIKTYQGAELRNAVSVAIEKVNGAITSTDGNLWLATSQGAIQYNGQEAITYTTTTDGFLVDDLRDVHEDRWGNIWFATWGGGVVRYDGNAFQSVTTKDGLIHNNVSSIHAANEKELWFGTEGGATQYRANLGALPFCRIVSVDAGKSFIEPFSKESGHQPITEIEELLPARLKDITIHFQGINPLRDDLEYQYRLIGIEDIEWSRVLSTDQQMSSESALGGVKRFYQPQQIGETGSFPNIRYEGLKSGKYTFMIKAFRKGWPYTQQPAVLNFTIDQPIWSRWRNYLPTLIFVAAVGSLLFRLIVNRRQTAQLQLEMREKEEAEVQRIRAELNEAQNIQMGLLPIEAPRTSDFDISGRSIPATQVGGDFFDYLTVANGQTAIAVADAAGKGIRGAMNAVLTNGMLHEVARYKSEADVILTDLNAGLSPRMYGPSFIALNLAVLDESGKSVDYANGGQPYPILKRGDQIVEIETSDLPLGSRKNVEYESATFDLNENEFLIFHSDGLIEALNSQQDMYGTERLNDLIAKVPSESSAEEMIQHIFDDVQEFVQEAEQYDDMTLVVLKRISVSE